MHAALLISPTYLLKVEAAARLQPMVCNILQELVHDHDMTMTGNMIGSPRSLEDDEHVQFESSRTTAAGGSQSFPPPL